MPLLVYPALRVMYPVIWRKDYLDSSPIDKFVSVSGTSHVVILLTAMLISIFSDVISYSFVLGSVSLLACIYISGALPCILYLKQTPEGDPRWLRILTAVVLFITFGVSLITFSIFLSYGEIYYQPPRNSVG